MGIGTSLNIALTGLRTNQTQLELASNNIANAGSTGYSRRVLETSALVAGDRTFGVQAGRIERTINLQVQRQWRTAAGNSAYADTRSELLQRLDALYGGPKDPTSLDTIFNGFKQAMETLATSPDNNSARIVAASSANDLAARIRSLSEDIQGLRQEAESGIGAAVTEANSLLQRISDIDKQIISIGSGGNSTAGLQDDRDAAIDALSKLMDIRVEEQDYGAVAIFLTNGTLIYDDVPAQFEFDEHGIVREDDFYSVNDSERALGTVKVRSGPGAGQDLFRDGAFRSGTIAALKELRDETLVQAQAQLDELASQMALAISNRTVEGTAATSGGAEGYDLDLSGLQEGNTFTVEYTDGSGYHKFTFVAHDGTASLDDDYTADPNDTVVGIDLSGGSGTIRGQVAAALGGMAVTDLGGNVLQVLDDGPAGSIDIEAMTASITATGLQGTPPDAALPLFIDSGTGAAFTGLVGDGLRKPGFAARIAVNPAVTADPAYLVKYASTTQPSDTTRPRAILDALTSTRFQYSPDTGIGSGTAPFSGTIEQFLKQTVSFQGAQAESAKTAAEGQSIVTANLAERYDGSRKVNVDEEMAMLIELQTAYQANARVMTVAREMIDALMNVL
jgi:flagellar hook-associated protein 1 FlgK